MQVALNVLFWTPSENVNTFSTHRCWTLAYATTTVSHSNRAFGPSDVDWHSARRTSSNNQFLRHSHVTTLRMCPEYRRRRIYCDQQRKLRKHPSCPNSARSVKLQTRCTHGDRAIGRRRRCRRVELTTPPGAWLRGRQKILTKAYRVSAIQIPKHWLCISEYRCYVIFLHH